MNNKEINKLFPGGRVQFSSTTPTEAIYLPNILPCSEDGEKYLPISTKDFVEAVAQEAYNKGCSDTKTKTRMLKDIFGFSNG